jgi:hypothetical protein
VIGRRGWKGSSRSERSKLGSARYLDKMLSILCVGWLQICAVGYISQVSFRIVWDCRQHRDRPRNHISNPQCGPLAITIVRTDRQGSQVRRSSLRIKQSTIFLRSEGRSAGICSITPLNTNLAIAPRRQLYFDGIQSR